MIFALPPRNGLKLDQVSWEFCILCMYYILSYIILATELGILPTAEFDGKTLSGNATIARYLAEEHGKHRSIVSPLIIA